MYCKKTYSFKPYLFILLINFAHDGMLNTLLTEQEHLCIGDDTKASLAAARTALGKQTIRSVQWRYLSHYRNSVEKNCLLAQNFSDVYDHAILLPYPIGVMGHGQKRFMAAVRHLDF